ncbi:hypothetical protein Taro_002054 [Colocasia esculenta]|uniref:Uncharacterized protein n=1 Tax=Colocasia esculenta TaxID=4460 RepID=A0A843TMH6_COLES|nr:hypothetical protein [Colocasia esculenta]
MDAKDILGLSKISLPAGPQEKRPRPPRDSQRKPDGVYALTGGWTPPLMPAVEASHLKRKQQQTENEKVRVVNGVPPTGDYSFAKFNKM